ncbi:hypothetical protein PR202_gb25860 [Eleusine coracana subsp. coracana]|uniref:TF-B3 domain-containing protein n=1 Tax=Eleusine coracana subsp. coracana TaxID=191504 RepID=A0AAV5FQD9_ELECO|nr:hypothetical protein PR202_gb25860 [Eleusine coracana subsp. coracana]
MGPSGDHRCRAISRHLKVLLPPSSSSSRKLRISDDFARHLDGAGESTAFVLSPLGSKVWRVEVGRDGGGAYLGRGWPEFVAAHGIGALWFVVFRHHGRGVLTVKAFDTSFCLCELNRPNPVDGTGNERETAAGSRRPQFFTVLLHRFKEKMVIPPAFVRKHITKAEMNSGLAVLSLCSKDQLVEVEKGRSGNVFFSGGWSKFLESNGITRGEALLLRHEGKMEFTVKVFGLDGCQKIFKSTNISDLRQTRQSVPMTFAADLLQGDRILGTLWDHTKDIDRQWGYQIMAAGLLLGLAPTAVPSSCVLATPVLFSCVSTTPSPSSCTATIPFPDLLCFGDPVCLLVHANDHHPLAHVGVRDPVPVLLQTDNPIPVLLRANDPLSLRSSASTTLLVLQHLGAPPPTLLVEISTSMT